MATVSLVEVNSSQLESDVKRLWEILMRAQNHLARLRDKMELLNSTWKGAANTAFQQRFYEDYERMMSLCASIRELVEILESIRRAYDACENDVRSAVDSLRI